jgi:hypothetical protein
MIVLNSPKGWTGPKMVDGLQIEGTFRSHQVPLHPGADVSIERIGDLLNHDRRNLAPRGAQVARGNVGNPRRCNPS